MFNPGQSNPRIAHTLTHLSSGCFSDLNYLVATEITLAGRCRSNAVCLIGLWVDPLSNGTRVQNELTIVTCLALRSASLYTATVLMPSLFAVENTRQAISPRLATSNLSNNWTASAVAGVDSQRGLDKRNKHSFSPRFPHSRSDLRPLVDSTV